MIGYIIIPSEQHVPFSGPRIIQLNSVTDTQLQIGQFRAQLHDGVRNPRTTPNHMQLRNVPKKPESLDNMDFTCAETLKLGITPLKGMAHLQQERSGLLTSQG